MKTLTAAALLICCTFLFACNRNAESKSLDQLPNNDQQLPQAGGNEGNPSLTKDSIAVATTANATFKDWDRSIIKTGTLKVETADFKNFSKNVRQTVKAMGGYIAQEDQADNVERSENSMIIKVPVEQFESMMNALPGEEGRLIERKINSDEVSSEIVDTKARVEVKEQLRLKYLDFLKQSKNVEEALKVQREINGLQEQIESAAGRVNYLSHQSLLSTINLSFYQPANGMIVKDEPKTGFMAKLARAFTSGSAALGQLLIGIISIWPLVLLIIVAILAWKKWKPAAGKQVG